MTVTEAQNQYNELLKRFNKANEYFERTDITREEKEKFLPDFQKVLIELSFLLGKIQIYTQQQALEGFHD